MLKAARAKPQAQAVQAVNALLDDARDRSVDEFVDRTAAALNAPKMSDLPPSDVCTMLREAGVDKAQFESIYSALSDRSFSKEKTIEIASLFTGARSTAWSTKPQALKAIKMKFDERVFLDSKSRHNVRVTPW